MTEEKTKKVIIASTIGAVLLAVILVSVLVYQLIAMGVEKRRIKYFEDAIAECEQMIADGENEKLAYLKRDWIIKQAYKYGYIFSTDQDITGND
jgi:predicted membrane protein